MVQRGQIITLYGGSRARVDKVLENGNLKVTLENVRRVLSPDESGGMYDKPVNEAIATPTTVYKIAGNLALNQT